jgi:hypothetical protein
VNCWTKVDTEEWAYRELKYQDGGRWSDWGLNLEVGQGLKGQQKDRKKDSPGGGQQNHEEAGMSLPHAV